MRVMDVVEAEAALDAEPVVIGRAVAALGIDHLLVLDLIGDLAADAAIRAQRVDLAVGIGDAGLLLVEHHRRHQRAGRAGLHAFAAGDAGGLAHRIVEVEHDLRTVTAIGHADDVVDLHLAAGAHAQAALDAGVEIDAHRRMAGIGLPALGGGEAALGDAGLLGPVPELRIGIVRGLARRLVGDQQLHHHLLRGDGARACASSPSCRRSACACRRPPARARPRSRPCRRGNCRRADSPARASSRDAGFPCPGVWPPARWSRRRWPRPACRRARTGSWSFGCVLELVREIFNHRGQRIRGRLAEAADRGIAHRLAQFVEQFAVPDRAVPSGSPPSGFRRGTACTGRSSHPRRSASG